MKILIEDTRCADFDLQLEKQNFPLDYSLALPLALPVVTDHKCNYGS